MKLHTKLICLPILMMLACPSKGSGEEGITWNMVRLSPRVSTSERYTNNAFLSPVDEKEEFITTISPGITVDLALSTKNILSLRYDGDFKFYQNLDNFNKDRHRTSLVWKLAAPGGSRFESGGSADYDSVQPYSITDRHKDFTGRTLFINTVLKSGAFTEMGLRYDHLSRRFESPLDTIDEFDNNTITFNLMYRRSPVTVPLFEYAYSHQNNNNISGPSTDMDTQTLFLGVQWDPASRLYGNLKGGYSMTNFKEINDFTGFVISTDLGYRVSAFTKLRINASRMLVKSTRAFRESGDYFISSGSGIFLEYHKWAPLTLSMEFSYKNNDYASGINRGDNLYQTGLRAAYHHRNWFSSSLSYSYKKNASNIPEQEYKENKVDAMLSFAI